jgi:hypothetical protein
VLLVYRSSERIAAHPETHREAIIRRNVRHHRSEASPTDDRDFG